MKTLAFIVSLLFIFPDLSGQQQSLLEHIRQDTVIDVYLSVDWKGVVKTKSDKSYLPGNVLVKPGNQDSIALPVKVKARGNMRFNICQIPPLKLKFKKSDLSRYNLASFNEMDVVHPCKNGELYEQFILREYLAYKLWALLSPYAFEVQLIRLHYIDPDGSENQESSYAFLTENTEELVARLDGRQNRTTIISSNAVEKETDLTMALFQFMIGNTDWNIQNRHNLEFVILPGHSLLVPIPYDFDYAGMVGTPYAVHHESLQLSSVYSRYYQGKCVPQEEVEAALQVFREQKREILAIPFSIHGMDEKSSAQAHQYLGDFFEIIENEKKLNNLIIRHCDMWPAKE